MLFALLLTISLFEFHGTSLSSEMASSVADYAASTDTWSRSSISMPATQNLVFSSPNLTTLEIPSQASPINLTTLSIDVVRGLEPMQRFDSAFTSARVRENNVANPNLTTTNNGISLSYDASSYPSYVVYNLSFVTPSIIHSADLISLGFSTDSSFNSSQGLIGVSFVLRDAQNARYYISVIVSDQNPADSFGLSEWFLGESYTSQFLKYPTYSLRYNSLSGPWFEQLSLSESFAILNLTSAWVDGLLVGGEIAYLGPPLGPQSLRKLDAMFHFALVHPQPFLINEQFVNSTVMVFPMQNTLSFSGMLFRSISVAVEGFLKPSSEKEELLTNETTSYKEVIFDLTRAAEEGVTVKGELNIVVFSRSVKKCLLTLDNNTFADLTDTLLSSKTEAYVFPKTASNLKIELTLYKFNSWIVSFSSLNVIHLTKTGVVEERFSTVEGEGLVDVNATVGRNTYLAISMADLTPRMIAVDGVQRPFESMLILDEEAFFLVNLQPSTGTFSLNSVQYLLSESPIYDSSTAIPFNVYFNGSAFKVFTPFNVEGERGLYLPITIQMITFRTFVLQINYDPAFFEGGQGEVMAYSTRIHYEYLTLKPLETGQRTVSLKITDSTNNRAVFSTLFSIRVSDSYADEFLYSMFGITVLSIVVLFWGNDFAKWIRSRLSRKESLQD
jgi:hypothetical protein